MTITIQLNDRTIELVRQAISRAGSISELARILHVTNTTIYRLLNKRSKTLRFSTVIKLEEYLKNGSV